MLVGIPREVKNRESRVALTPDGAAALTERGHEVVVESAAGLGAGFVDDDYARAGARVGSADDAWGAELVLKVKEPVPDEYPRLRGDLTLFTFLHLAANEPLATALVESGCAAISYDTVRASDGSLPILRPMSEVAGRLSVIAGAYHLLGPQGGRGLLLSGLGGADGVRVAVIGAGVAGSNAALQATAMGADVTALDLDESRLATLRAADPIRIRTEVSSPDAIASAVAGSDLVVGAVLIPGSPRPQGRHPRDGRGRSARARSSSTSRSIREGASRTLARPPTTTRRSGSRVRSSTASRTCRALRDGRRRRRSRR